MKSMQSIALLNFSPSYMVNNFLNNLITRTVSGVGGVDTDFLKTVNAERGLFFSRGDSVTDAYSNTGKAIRKNKKANDTLQKISDISKKATNSEILKGINRLPIEEWEQTAAKDIGSARHWDATWRMNRPDLPDTFDALGMDNTTKARLNDLMLDSPNVEVFRHDLMGEVNTPKANSVIEHTLNKYDGKAKTIMEDMVSKFPEVKETLTQALKTNDLTESIKVINTLQDKLTNKIDLENVKQIDSTYQDLRNRFSGEGLGAVGTASDTINHMNSDIWIRQSKQNLSLFMDRILKKESSVDFDPRYEQLLKMQTGDYNIVRGYAVNIASAMCDGLGLSNDVSVKIVENTMKRFDIPKEQVLANHDLYQKFATKNSPDFDINYYIQSRLDMLQKTQDIQLQADIDLDNILVQHLRDTLEPSKAGYIDTYEKRKAEIIEEKRKLNERELKDLEKRLNAMGKRQRFDFAYEQERAINKADFRTKQEWSFRCSIIPREQNLYKQNR